MRKPDEDPQVLRQSAAMLLHQQFVYSDRQTDRRCYHVIAAHEDYFASLFDQVGRQLIVGREYGFAGILPYDGINRHARLRQDETLMLLCLRLLYEEGVENFESPNGCVTCNAFDLIHRYETETRIDQPTLGRFREIATLFRQHGIIDTHKKEDKNDHNDVVIIRPAIRHIVGADFMAELELCLGNQEDSIDEVSV